MAVNDIRPPIGTDPIQLADPGDPRNFLMGKWTEPWRRWYQQIQGLLVGLNVMGPSGPRHAPGIVGDPGALAGATKFWREDAVFALPAGGSQTPWTSDIDGGDHELSNTKSLTLVPGSSPANAAGKLRVNAAGNLDLSDAGTWRLIWTPVAGGIGFQNSWVNGGATASPVCSYLRDPLGFVSLRGACTGGTFSAGADVFTLPSEFRPPAGVAYKFMCPCNSLGGLAFVAVLSTGEVQIQSAPGNAFLILDSIRFATF